MIISQEQVDIKTPEFVSLQFQLAGLGSRASAFIIDQLIVMVGNLLLFLVLFLVDMGFQNVLFTSTMSPVLFAILIIVVFIINWGYFFALEYFFGGRTIGKKMMGIRVIQENGHSLTLLSSFIRNLLRIIDSLPSAYFVGIVMVFFHSKHKRLGDIVAGTIVVHERKAKNKKTINTIEKEIETRGLTKEYLTVDDWSLRGLGEKDWKLLKTYSQRFPQLPPAKRMDVTKQISAILFPKIGVEQENKSSYQMENILLSLYMKLKEEWEYEL